MLAGAFGYRVPAPEWKPAGWTPPVTQNATQTARHVHVDRAWRLPQFWFLWGRALYQRHRWNRRAQPASPMIQEMFGGRLIGVSETLAALTTEQKAAVATIAAGFTGLLSLASWLAGLDGPPFRIRSGGSRPT